MEMKKTHTTKIGRKKESIRESEQLMYQHRQNKLKRNRAHTLSCRTELLLQH